MALKKMNKKQKRDIFYALTLVTQLGITMLVPIFICTGFGIWLMKSANNPLIVIFFSFFGFAVAFRNAYVLVSKMFINDKGQEDTEYEYFKKLEQERNKRLDKRPR